MPITPSIVVSVAVHETAGFHDGSVPGATVVPWTETGYASNRDVEIISAVSSIVPVIVIFRFGRVRVAPCTLVLTSISRRRIGTGVFVQSVYKRLENNTLRTLLSSYPGKSDYAKCNPTTSMEVNLLCCRIYLDKVKTRILSLEIRLFLKSPRSDISHQHVSSLALV